VFRAAVRQAADLVDIQWQVLQDTLRVLAPYAKGKLLDVGCGEKPHEAIFAPYVTSYVGIEHASTFATTASGSKPPKADYFYDGVRLPFDDASFDTVLSVQVLEHTRAPPVLVHEMARVLAPNGTLLLTAPFSFRMHGLPHDYFRFTPHGLRALCEEAGLEVDEHIPMGGFWSVLGQKLSTLLAFRIARVGGVAQALGKAGHERVSRQRLRYWTLPAIAPSLLAIAAVARALDRIDPERVESLGFAIIARKA